MCHEGFLIRSLGALSFPRFGFHNQVIDSIVIYCHKLENLVESLGPLFECEFVKEEVQDYNGSMDWIDVFSDMDKKMAKRKMIEELG